MKLLVIADAVAHTGFATVTHALCDRLKKDWDITILGINYYGDPHSYPYPIYPARPNEQYDFYGVRRLPEVYARVQPDVVLIINDPWVCKEYMPALERANIVLYTLADAPHLREDFVTPLNAAKHVIAYTEFAANELKKAGLTVPTSVIYHGVDTDLFKPKGKEIARRTFNLHPDWFIVGAVNRNQPRKRLDLTIEYFAEWAKNKPDSVKFYYHGALQDTGWNIVDLACYYGIKDRLIITSRNLSPETGIPRDMLPYVYSSFDVQVSTTLGEGFGLTTAEGLACGVPQIVPDYSALGEWCRHKNGEAAVHYVPCTSTAVTPGGVNTLGGIIDKQDFIDALEKMYTDATYRAKLSELGLRLVRHKRFNWGVVAKDFNTYLASVLN